MSANLDILRATAVSIVLAIHLQAFFIGGEYVGPFSTEHIGRWGVLMFFVHTSLVLMGSLERIGGSGRRRVLRFYVRRVFRLYPLAIFCVVAVTVLGIPAVPHGTFAWIGWQHFASNLALTTNITQSPDALGPLWSLPYEMQMYLVLPALFALATRARGAVWLLLTWATAGLLATAIGGLPFYQVRVVQYVPCFVAGVVAYALGSANRRTLPAWLWPVWIVAVGVAYAWVGGGRWTGWVACLALGASIPYFRESRMPRVNQVALEVCTYSYGIYLAHSPIIWVAFVAASSLPFLLQCAIFAVMLVCVPYMLYRWLEHPMNLWGAKLVQPRPTAEQTVSGTATT